MAESDSGNHARLSGLRLSYASLLHRCYVLVTEGVCGGVVWDPFYTIPAVLTVGDVMHTGTRHPTW